MLDLPVAAAAGVWDVVQDPPVEAEIIGAFPTAVYLRLPDSRVVAVVTTDGVRLPCAVVLVRDTTVSLPDLSGPALVGGGFVTFPGLRLRVARTFASTVGRYDPPDPHKVRALTRALASVDLGIPTAEFTMRRLEINSLIGRGPGLTPAGDDLISGMIAGARAWRLPIATSALTAALAAGRTTDLSAQLLRDAMAGHACPQVRTLIAVLSSPQLSVGSAMASAVELLEIGHTSGAALAHGVLWAARLRCATASVDGGEPGALTHHQRKVS
jgi:hypothetical protein